MHIILMLRSLTTAQKAVKILQSSGIFASVTKAPQNMNPGGCTYGAKIAERNLQRALTILSNANIDVRKIIETDGIRSREVSS